MKIVTCKHCPAKAENRSGHMPNGWIRRRGNPVEYICPDCMAEVEGATPWVGLRGVINWATPKPTKAAT